MSSAVPESLLREALSGGSREAAAAVLREALPAARVTTLHLSPGCNYVTEGLAAELHHACAAGQSPVLVVAGGTGRGSKLTQYKRVDFQGGSRPLTKDKSLAHTLAKPEPLDAAAEGLIPFDVEKVFAVAQKEQPDEFPVLAISQGSMTDEESLRSKCSPDLQVVLQAGLKTPPAARCSVVSLAARGPEAPLFQPWLGFETQLDKVTKPDGTRIKKRARISEEDRQTPQAYKLTLRGGADWGWHTLRSGKGVLRGNDPLPDHNTALQAGMEEGGAQLFVRHTLEIKEDLAVLNITAQPGDIAKLQALAAQGAAAAPQLQAPTHNAHPAGAGPSSSSSDDLQAFGNDEGPTLCDNPAACLYDSWRHEALDLA